MAKQRRVIAAAFALVAVFIVLSSSIFMIEHADHDCTGADCPICACAQSLRNLVAGAMASMVVAAFRFAAQAVMGQAKYAYAPHTPVNLKVKLSN